MISNKVKLLALTALSTIAAAPAVSAPIAYPAATLHGNGASSIANVLVQELNCYGGPNYKQGIVASGVKTTFDTAEFNYTPKTATAANPNYNCGTQSVQTNVGGEYVSTGSGGGRSNWTNLTDASTHVGGSNPFEDGSARNGAGAEAEWGNIHFAFSDAAISSTELNTYNTNAAPTAGAAIQIPLYVLPVAVAYPQSYGTLNDGSTAGGYKLQFNLKFPRKVGTQLVGGLRLTKVMYCGIFQGTLTNYNAAAFKTANGNLSLMDSHDNASRWNTEGVPIILVGRQESSGTTNIFTRALAAQCGGDYTQGTNTLPAARVGTVVYNENGTLASGTEANNGKFGVVPNSDGVSNVISAVPAQPGTVGDVALNGHLGYIGSDWVLPSTINGTSNLLSADLQIGGGYKGPTAANATAAAKVLKAPESASTGKYAPVAGCNSTTAGCRKNPLSWVQSSAATETLAKPTAGYPIVGTTNALLYTCYKSTAIRTALDGFLNFHFGKLTATQTSETSKFPVALVSVAAPGADGQPAGIDAKSGIAPLPAPVITAIVETFLKKDTTGSNPSTLGLYIQDKLPANQAGIATLQSNPSCSAGVGA